MYCDVNVQYYCDGISPPLSCGPNEENMIEMDPSTFLSIKTMPLLSST